MKKISAAFEGVETATVGHFQSQGFMSPNIRTHSNASRIFGPALTVMIPADDGAALVYALSAAEPGQVVVVDRNGDDQHACWGAVTTAAAQARGVIGAVIDGYITDLAAVKAAKFPIWCRGLSPLTTKIRGESGHFGQAVSCGGVSVTAENLILADENGVVVLDYSEALSIGQRAAQIQAAEPNVIAQLKAGKTLAEITNPPALPEFVPNEG